MKTVRIEIDEKNKSPKYRKWLRDQFDDVLDSVLGIDLSLTREELEEAIELFAILRLKRGEKGAVFMPEEEILKRLSEKYGKQEMNDHWDKISEKGYDIAEEIFYERKAEAAAKRKQEEEEEEQRIAERARLDRQEDDLLASNAMAAEFKAAAGDRLKNRVTIVRSTDPFQPMRGFSNVCSGDFRNGMTESCLHEAVKFKQLIRTSDAGLKGFEFKGKILDGTEFIGVDKAQKF